MDVLRREAVKHCVVRRVTSNELPLQVRGKLRNDKVVARGYRRDFVTIGFAFGSTLQIEQARIP